MSPFYQLGLFGYPVAMALATVLGVGFGFALERAGFGRASTLVAQFYFDDMRVLKVMFSGIVTTTIGLGILGGLGLIDLSLITIPGTWYVPAIVGGLLLGVGFVVSGYCPGTALVAVGSGHLDGLVALLGIMIGSLVFGFAYENDAVESLYLMTARGEITFVEVWDIPWQVLAAGVTVIAIGAFFASEKAEQIFAPRHGREAPCEHDDPRTRNVVFGVMGAFALVGLGTLALPASVATPDTVAASAVPTMNAVELADRLARNADGVFVVDLRDHAACDADKIRGAMCVGEEGPGFIAELPATRTLVLYGAAELEDLPAAVAHYDGPVRRLEGGYPAFDTAILHTPTPPDVATPEAIDAYEHRAALHQWFTGSDAPAAPVMARPVAPRAASGPRGGGC
jgi:hypothetical protein